jgi:hypothetical protein
MSKQFNQTVGSIPNSKMRKIPMTFINSKRKASSAVIKPETSRKKK